MTNRKHNLWPFGKKTEKCATRRSSMTISQSTAAAYRAGQKSGDTGLFRAWLCSKGLQDRGNALVSRLKKEYERGVDGQAQTGKKLAGPVKADPPAVVDDVIAGLQSLGMKSAEAKKKTLAAYRGGDDFDTLFKKVVRRQNPKLLGWPKQILQKFQEWRKKNPAKKKFGAADLLLFLPAGAAAHHFAKKAFNSRMKKSKRTCHKAGLKTIRLNLAKPKHSKLGQREADLIRKQREKSPGRRRAVVKFSRNPLDAATKTYEEFHGLSPKGVIEIAEKEHRHSLTSGVGYLLAWIILDIDGKRQRLLLAPGYRYTGPDSELFPDYKGQGKGEWQPGGDVKSRVLVSQAEQTERGRKYGQLFLKGGDQSVNTNALGLTARDQHEDMLLGTIIRIWYRTAKSFEDEGSVKQNFFHDFGKQGSAGVMPVLTYQPLNPSMKVVGGRYYIAPPDSRLKGVSSAGVSPGIVG